MKADRELSEQKTVKRFVRNEKRQAKDGYGATQEFAAWAPPEIVRLSDHIRQASLEPGDPLAEVLRPADPVKLAIATLGALTHEIAVNSDVQDLFFAIGRAAQGVLFDAGMLKASKKWRAAIDKIGNPKARRKALARAGWRDLDWARAHQIKAGSWLADCALRALPNWFVHHRHGYIDVREEVAKEVNDLCETLPWQNPVVVPMTSPPKPWTGWREGGFWSERSRISVPFVKSHNPETEKAIRVAFADGSMVQHVDAINSLQAVPWRINEPVLAAVKQYADRLRDKKRLKNRLKERKLLINDDIATARRLCGSPFWTPNNIDFRGRAYPIPSFSHVRGDHVRGMFLFDRGLPLETEQAERRLMDYTAACYGEDKGTLDDRRQWVAKNKDLIERTAKQETEEWLEVDSPFLFLAACIELTAAWRDGLGFVTRLPLAFDGKCNAIQHQCAMLRAEEGAKVNLTAAAAPQDVYADVLKHVVIAARNAGIRPDIEINRRLVKQPVMTVGYGATFYGMRQQLKDELKDRGQGEWSEVKQRANGLTLLTKYVLPAIDIELPRCREARDFLRSIARALAKKGETLRWTTPTGLPWANQYDNLKTEQVSLLINSVRVRLTVADGFEPGIRSDKAIDAVTANVTHAMDAAHMCRVVNACAAEGIVDIMTIHDSFGCLAPQAERFNEIIREEFVRLYEEHDPLAEIRERALCVLGANAKLPPVPPRGTLNLQEIRRSTYAFA